MVCLFAMPITYAQLQSGVLTMNSPLYEKPDRSSNSIIILKEDTEVTILELKTTWYRVRVIGNEQQEGWVWLNVKPESKNSLFSGMKRLFNDDEQHKEEVVATIGIRGLEKGDIKQAKPNKKELEKLEKFASKKNDAVAFANEINLNSNQTR